MTLLETKAKTLSGASIVIKTLQKLGVDSIFGYPGGIVLEVYDELYKQDKIKHYLVRHEQSAVHAAEGYARVSGKCGVAIVTSGPGATNIVTGVANAYLDGYPLVVITGQVLSSLIGKDAFQEVDIIDITKSCTKKNFQVRNINNLQETLVEALHTAMSDKKGPVVVDIAKDVFTQQVEFKENFEFKIDEPITVENDIIKALKEICNAKSPVLVVGGGVAQAQASKEVLEFAKALDLPVVSTMMGIGAYPQDDDNYLGMVGLFGDYSANQTLKESDLIFSLGARFNDRIRCCFKNNELKRHFIQLDINQSEISRLIPATTSLVGNVKDIIPRMLKDFDNSNINYNKLIRNEWLKEVKNYKLQNKTYETSSSQITSFEVIKTVSDILQEKNPVVTTEVGQHQVWTARGFKFNKEYQFVTSGGLGTMGFGFPAAIGASIARKNEPIICFAGDGSLQMSIQELATCMDYNLPIKIFILNNGYLGMVRQFQEKSYEGRYSETKISNPDYVKLASAYGACGIRVTKKEELPSAIKTAYNIEGTVLVDIAIKPEELL